MYDVNHRWFVGIWLLFVELYLIVLDLIGFANLNRYVSVSFYLVRYLLQFVINEILSKYFTNHNIWFRNHCEITQWFGNCSQIIRWFGTEITKISNKSHKLTQWFYCDFKSFAVVCKIFAECFNDHELQQITNQIKWNIHISVEICKSYQVQ